ncbi:MAG: serine hydroxymethyltransferase [Thermoplasmata archaeon HGW-Thermoplasmata-1]|nr:MAG: serine hydroxymethyltransferase [Thermoplasmata archaeon HGW-Thermoplasmata-1]
MSYLDDANYIRGLAKKNNELFGDSLPMIASENVLSPMCMEMLISDFHGRYAEGHPGKRYYQGCKIFDDVETKGVELAKKLFNCSFANIQATSGTVANMAVFKALAKPGERVTVLPTAAGAHISHGKIGGIGVRGLDTVEFPFDKENMNLDIEGSKKVIREAKPKFALFGQSVFLFPTPLEELAEVSHELGARVVYDAAHVLGLIAGGKFQDPLREGADVMMGSTHKTLPGPQGGVILSDVKADSEINEKFLKAIDFAVFPGVTSSYHLHHCAAKAIAFAEHLEFGREYAGQMVSNAKALAQGLHERDFNVLGEKLGFTESHQVVVQIGEVGEAKGRWAAQVLEDAGIICNMNMVPEDTSALNPSGLRLGVPELTRMGMKEKEMGQVAEFYKRALIDLEDPTKVKEDVRAFKQDYRIMKFCFVDNWDAYRYNELF